MQLVFKCQYGVIENLKKKYYNVPEHLYFLVSNIC